jgi:hypothetical protein
MEEKFAQACADAVNPMGFSPKKFCAALARQHRTLQQGFTRLCFAWIKHLASLEGHEYDLRNAASVQVCKKIVSGEIKDEYDLSLPLI